MATCFERPSDWDNDVSSCLIAWSPCGRFVACANDSPSHSPHANVFARIWCAQTKLLVHSIPIPAPNGRTPHKFVQAIQFVGEQLVIVTETECIVVHAPQGPEPLWTLVKRIPVDPLTDVQVAYVSPLGLVALGYYGAIRVIHIDEEVALPPIKTDVHVRAIGISFDGTKVAAITSTGDQDTSVLKVWRTHGGELIHTVSTGDRGEHQLVWANQSDAIALSMNDRVTVVRICPDGITERCSAAPFKNTYKLGVSSMAWSPDDAFIACIVLNDIIFLRASDLTIDPARVMPLDDPAEGSDEASIAFAPDGTAVATLEYWVEDHSQDGIAPHHPFVRKLA